jgi:hypothetical protein
MRWRMRHKSTHMKPNMLRCCSARIMGSRGFICTSVERVSRRMDHPVATALATPYFLLVTAWPSGVGSISMAACLVVAYLVVLLELSVRTECTVRNSKMSAPTQIIRSKVRICDIYVECYNFNLQLRPCTHAPSCSC